MKIALFTIILSFSAVLFGCKDDEPQPPQQQVKKDITMNYTSLTTCKVNDKEWRDCFPSALINQSRSSGQWWKNYIGNPLEIFASNGCDENNITHIGMRINDFTGVGRYELGVHSYGVFSIARFPLSLVYKTDTTYRGAVEITNFDTTKKLVDGTFYFQVFDTDSNKTINITNGKFSKVSFITF